MAESPKYLLVDSAVAPEVFVRVVHAKQLIAQGKAANASQAAQQAGISRSAFYKYKDYVYRFDEQMRQDIVTLNVALEDEPGVLSNLLTLLYREGANIITVNQNIPADGVALVSVALRLGKEVSPEQITSALSSLQGVIRVSNV